MAENKGKDAGEKEVQATSDAETEQGFVGTKVDPTPNENYTLAGVLAGAPTPETDAQAAADARAAVDNIQNLPPEPAPTRKG